MSSVRRRWNFFWYFWIQYNPFERSKVKFWSHFEQQVCTGPLKNGLLRAQILSFWPKIWKWSMLHINQFFISFPTPYSNFGYVKYFLKYSPFPKIYLFQLCDFANFFGRMESYSVRRSGFFRRAYVWPKILKMSILHTLFVNSKVSAAHFSHKSSDQIDQMDRKLTLKNLWLRNWLPFPNFSIP